MENNNELNEVLSIIDVGHGNSSVLFSGGDVAIFDTGPGSSLLEFLKEQQVTRIKTVYLSHADKDHIGGLIGIFSSKIVQVDRVLLNSDSLKKSAIWDDLLYELDRAHNAGELCFEPTMTSGDKENIGSITASVVGPSRYLAAKGPGSTDRADRRISSNSISAVIRLCIESEPIVTLPGDVDQVGLEDLMRAGVSADAPILIFPHHGGQQGTGDISEYVRKIVDVVRPQTVIFSIGRERKGNPNPSLMAALRQFVPHVRIICTQLSKHCAQSSPDVSPSHLSGVFARGRSDKACCGGTIIISLNNPGKIIPERDDHLAFIENAVEIPLCIE